MDKSLIIKLTEIQSTLSEDTEINNFIFKYLSKINGVKLKKDSFGNIYAVKGRGKNGYKCIVSHTDTVHSMESNRFVVEIKNTLFAFADSKNAGFHSSKIKQVGIGGDDKCGVYTCIKAIEDFDDIKAVFFRFEETGCKGSNQADMDFFKDCNLVLQCDRKGKSDFIVHTNGIQVSSKEFEKEAQPIFEKYGYKSAFGIATDVGVLRKRGLTVSSANISCGYYDPHSSNETIDLNDLENCYLMVSDIFNTIGDKRHSFAIVKEEPRLLPATKKKGRFSFNHENNYFKDIVSMEIDVIGPEQSIFVEIDNTKLFNLVESQLIFLDGCECESCGSKTSLLFSSEDGAIYCSEQSGCGFLLESDSYRKCIIETNGIVFCYDKLSGCWIMDCDAYWDEMLNTYQLISEDLTV